MMHAEEGPILVRLERSPGERFEIRETVKPRADGTRNTLLCTLKKINNNITYIIVETPVHHMRLAAALI